MKDEDAETEDNQTKKGGCEDFSRDEEQEDVESQYSLDDETIFTKAGISSTQMVRSKNLTDRWLTAEESVVKPCWEWTRTSYFCCLCSATFLLMLVKLILSGSHSTFVELVPEEGCFHGILLHCMPVLVSEASPSITQSKRCEKKVVTISRCAC